jgi:PAS domain-containing protein
MRLWRDEKTAGISMKAVTHVRDMLARVHDFDWDATPLGPRRTWSSSLAWSVDLILASGFPMSVRWGPDLIMIYNDAYASLLGDRHPRALGRPLRDIAGVLATAFEITDRVRDEQTLRVLTDRLESEVQQRTRERDRIWAVSEDLLGVANFEGYFLSVNPAWTNLLSWTEDEIKALHVNELRHPEDAAAAIAARARLAQGIPTVRVENRASPRRQLALDLMDDDGR